MTIAEKVALKLSDKLGKSTLHVQWLDGTVTDIQINDDPRLEFDEHIREPILNTGYKSGVLVRMSQVRCYEVEENRDAAPQTIP